MTDQSSPETVGETMQQITPQNFIRLGILAFKEHELREIVAAFCKLPGIAPQPLSPAQCPDLPVAWRWKDTSDNWLYSETEPALLTVGRLNEVQPLYASPDTSTDRGGK